SRKIYLNIDVPQDKLPSHAEHYCTNAITTSQYTYVNFLPKNLSRQFRRVANIYFLVLTVLQLIGYFALGSWILTILPILLVLAITAIKDAFEDWRRHISDNHFNETGTRIVRNLRNTNLLWQDNQADLARTKRMHHLRIQFARRLNKKTWYNQLPSEWEESQNPVDPAKPPVLNEEARWRNVRVGDFVILKTGDPAPADMLMLATSAEDGSCYVETKNLDGETNLKPRSALAETSGVRDAEGCARTRAVVEVDPPTSNMTKINGSIRIFSTPASDPLVVPFSINNVLLRGMTVRNTDWIVCLVLYTGEQTKIVLNSGPTPYKRSRIERMMNTQVMMSFGFVFATSFIVALVGGLKYAEKEHRHSPYVDDTMDKGTYGFALFWSAMIMLQNVIPIALYVSIEFVKSWHAYWIYQDLNMYYEPTDQRCVARNWNISDDLGQVSYIFSDKTGTLTRNVMDFRMCSINGTIYGKQLPGDELDVVKGRMAQEEVDRNNPPEGLAISPHIAQRVGSRPSISHGFEVDAIRQKMMVDLFMTELATCHSVVVEKSFQKHIRDMSKLAYSAESPDEGALVRAAKNFGYTFLGRVKNTIYLDIRGEKVQYEVLDTIEFNSTRKRMSNILRRPAPHSDIILFTKGADNVMIDRLSKLPSNNDFERTMRERTFNQIDEFANAGLRTLMLGYRIISEGEWVRWSSRYHAAQASLDEDREEQIAKVTDEMERDLRIAGATAIEDKLQERVPETIASLRAAGIKIWVLTGDKMETAINIGFAANLLTKEMELWTINSSSGIDKVLSRFKLIARIMREMAAGHDSAAYHPLNALVIDGAALSVVLGDPESRAMLLEIAPLFKSVVCCRASPLQKAEVVKLVKDGLDLVTLAIGDGANDVSMIQTADIGVAISGEEGLQAAMASDYTVGRFHFLQNLLLVHGLFDYLRMSEMILSFFYKNVIWAMVPFWYSIYCAFSANVFYDLSYIQLYNVVFTVSPVIILGCVDKPFNYQTAMTYVAVYIDGIHNRYFKWWRYYMYVIDGIYQSVVIFFTFYLFTYKSDMNNENGKTWGRSDLCTGPTVAVVIAASLCVGFNAWQWNWMMAAAIAFSIVVCIAYLAIASLVRYYSVEGVATSVMSTIAFWFGTIISVVVALLPRYCVRCWQKMNRPRDLDIIRE
ncbi:phospholipid-translocating P-type ATPase, partial [Martensiomyces pterosporus]